MNAVDNAIDHICEALDLSTHEVVVYETRVVYAASCELSGREFYAEGLTPMDAADALIAATE